MLRELAEAINAAEACDEIAYYLRAHLDDEGDYADALEWLTGEIE